MIGISAEQHVYGPVLGGGGVSNFQKKVNGLFRSLTPNISQVGHMWPQVATSIFNIATSGNRNQVARHLNAM